MVHEALSHQRLDKMPRDEAAALLAVRRAEGLSDSEAQLLAEWLAADEANRQALAATDRTWQHFDQIEDNEILAAMRAHARAPRQRGWGLDPRMAAAAAILILIMATSLVFGPSLFRGPTREADPSVTLAWTRYASAHGAVRAIALSDGSVVTLDTESVVETRLAADTRAIRLVRGRALFEVAPDASRPFAVSAGGRRVVALGTRFEVDLGGSALRVKLLKGSVAVEPGAGGRAIVTLKPGQEFIAASGAEKVRSVDVAAGDPAWRRGLIDLDDVPLNAAAAQINRYSRDQIVISDPDVAAIRVSGQFRIGDAARFASTVAELHQVRVTRRRGKILLGKK
jgi:transmembrane sensor